MYYAKSLKSITSHHIVILIIILIAFGLRIALVEQRTVTIDEISTLKWIADKSIFEIATRYHTNNHLLTSILARLLDHIGHWLMFYRAPSLIFGVLAIPFTYQLGRRLFSSSAGIIAALLLALAPFHVDFSLQIRGYAAVTFWAVVMYFCVWQSLVEGRRQTWGWLALAAVLTAYAHLFGALAVGASWTIILGAWLYARWRGQSPIWQKDMIISLVLTIVGIVILYGPVFSRVVDTPNIEQKWGSQIEPLLADGSINAASLADYLKVLRLYGPVGEPNSWFVMMFVAIAAIGLVALLVGFSPKLMMPQSEQAKVRRKATAASVFAGLPHLQSRTVGLAMIIWLFAPMAVSTLGLQFIDGFYVFRRFFIFFQPLYLILMAIGMLFIGWLIGMVLRSATARYVVTSGLVLIAVGAACWKLYDQTFEDIDNQWQHVARIIQTQHSNSIVICEAQGHRMQDRAVHKDECMRNLEFYLQQKLAEPVPWLHQDIDKIATIPGATNLPELEQHPGDAWLVLWQNQWPPEWPAMLETDRVNYLTYYSVGSTLLVHAPERSVQLLALADLPDALIPLETTPEDRFSYLMSQAQMKAVIGHRDSARDAWLTAEAISPEGIDAPNRLRAVAALIGMLELIE